MASPSNNHPFIGMHVSHRTNNKTHADSVARTKLRSQRTTPHTYSESTCRKYVWHQKHATTKRTTIRIHQALTIAIKTYSTVTQHNLTPAFGRQHNVAQTETYWQSGDNRCAGSGDSSRPPCRPPYGANTTSPGYRGTRSTATECNHPVCTSCC